MAALRAGLHGKELELGYFRDTDAREVDFVVMDHGKPVMCVECKWLDADVDRSVRYLHRKFPAAGAWQISATGSKDFQTPDGIQVSSANRSWRSDAVSSRLPKGGTS